MFTYLNMFTYLKQYKNILSVVVLLLLIGTLIYQNNALKNTRADYSVLANNNKALQLENTELQDGVLVYQFRIDQMEYFNDSINQKLDSVIKVNGLQKNKIKQLQYLQTQTSKTDTILLKDTVFREGVNIDTTLVQPGYSLNLKLTYPNKIQTTPIFYNDMYTVFSYQKQTIEPPKKFFLLRWFQRKHTVVTVDVYNTNPYVSIKNKRFIEIMK